MLTHDRFRVTTIGHAQSDAVVGARNGVIHSWNAGAERLFGYSAEEIFGQSVATLYPPERESEREEIPLGSRRDDRGLRDLPAAARTAPTSKSHSPSRPFAIPQG